MYAAGDLRLPIGRQFEISLEVSTMVKNVDRLEYMTFSNLQSIQNILFTKQCNNFSSLGLGFANDSRACVPWKLKSSSCMV